MSEVGSPRDPSAAPEGAGTGAAPPWPPAARWQKPLFLLFLAAFAINEVMLILRVEMTGAWRWLEALLLLSAAANALLSLAWRLPLQNVLTAAALILSFSGVTLALGTVTGVPFGPILFGEALGPRLFDTVPWSLPVMWVVLIVNGRAVARLMMRPWRRTNYYGYWVLGLTALLAVHFDLGLEPFAVKVNHYWLWQPTHTALLWYTAPWVNFLGWFAVAMAIVGLTLPWLINKQPVKRPMDYHPLVQWLLLHLWCLTGNALHELWPACAVTLAGCLATVIYAVRGARW